MSASGVGGRMGAVRLLLLGGARLLRDGEPVPVPAGAMRVLVFLGLQEHAVPRVRVAAALWPDSRARAAEAALRTALWRLRQAAGVPVVDTAFGAVRLAPAVAVDLRESAALARRLADTAEPSPPEPDAFGEALRPLGAELVPEYDDDWLLAERARWDQLRLHALDGLAEQLLAAGRYAQAIDAALAATGVDALRETAHRLLVRAYAAEGNPSLAVAHFERYRHQLRRELGLSPTPDLTRFVDRLIGPVR